MDVLAQKEIKMKDEIKNKGKMKLKDTVISMAGKYRCCASLGASPDRQDATEMEVSVGDTLSCYA